MLRFHLLDFLRGLASLAVVIWHYQHFYVGPSGVVPPDFDRASQPLYWALWLIYERGFQAVALFFVLSGFVFFYRYGEAVRSRAVGAREFFILRFSRLYPLHIVTLLLVACGQIASQSIDGRSVVYQCNDGGDFLLNVFLVSYWLPRGDVCWSFNGPVWSVSAEVFLYALFFVFALFLPASWRGRVGATAGMMLAAYVAQKLRLYHLVGFPTFCFFSGGLAFLIWQKLRDLQVPASRLMVGTGLGLALSLPIGTRWSFPAAVLFLATLQIVLPSLGRRLRVIGDITYSTYLLHFPLALALLLLVKAGGMEISVLHGVAGWSVYFLLLISVSVPTYYLFELPSQNAIRNRFFNERE